VNANQRALSAGLSRQAQPDSIRWKAPECLHHTDDADSTNPRWASDVFELGMTFSCLPFAKSFQ
jgi:hypothetical protein